MPASEEQFQLIDVKILKAEECVLQAKKKLCDLRTQRNSLLSICRLPNEVLGLILTFCVQEIRAGMRPDPFMSMPISWLWVTHVCRYWRAVSLSYPGLLWADIVTKGHRSHAFAAQLEAIGIALPEWVTSTEPPEDRRERVRAPAEPTLPAIGSPKDSAGLLKAFNAVTRFLDANREWVVWARWWHEVSEQSGAPRVCD